MVRLHCQPGPRLGSGTPRLWLDVMVVTAATRTTAARASTREAVQLNFMARPPSRRGRYARVMPVNCELVHTHSSTLITLACGVRQREPAAFEDHAARVKRSGGADWPVNALKIARCMKNSQSSWRFNSSQSSDLATNCLVPRAPLRVARERLRRSESCRRNQASRQPLPSHTR